MRHSFRNLWDRFGYACVLAVCLILVGTTAILTRKPKDETEAPEVTRYVLETPTPRPASVDVTIEPTATPTPFLMPATGKMGMTYADDTVIYNKTLGEYCTHSGIDILGEEGDAVRAVEDGTVTRVWEDALLGHCLEITHRSGYISTYASLASAGLVAENDAVSRGQIIGTMGVSAASECAEGPHVHFELKRLRMLIDPLNFLQED